MTEYLYIENVGPVNELTIDFSPRLNFITGDNGLGKSFLLDIFWWAAVQKWPTEINQSLTVGHPILPKDRLKQARIVRESTIDQRVDFNFDRKSQKWSTIQPIRHRSNSILIYMQSDGSISISDRSRNYKQKTINSVPDDYIMGIPDSDPYVFTYTEILSGLKNNGNQICNGLIQDWAYWQKDQNENFSLLKKIVQIIGKGTDIAGIGDLIRVYVDDVRDIPTIVMPYGEVPLSHISSGAKRLLTLSYLLVWTWQEHKRASQLRDIPITKEIILLIDEIDAHLHPKWQRTIVKSLMEAINILAPEVNIQFVATTHSPLVMASIEPFFDPEQDAWFDLDLNRESGQVEVTKRPWYRRGDADAWLKSEAFDQKSGYALETEQAIADADAAMGNSETTREQALAIDQRLLRLLGDIDTFWIRWRFYFEDRGWQR
ncbi:AAA family ATPase [Armatimonas sp.]|uniref:AAA family ATPase n=1 Tax=Armatimonas sp. TaxID=1872638 RepID=UPI003750F38F